ncbi:MAG: S9 family peptidase [Burkholderiales bacterium]|nr:S9 family peptidase [Burkholderiales bacterium]
MILASAATCVHAQGQTTPGPAPTQVPLQDFFRAPDVLRPALSPDGNHLAFLARASGRLGLAVIDVERRTSRMVATLPDADVVEHYWVNSTRLAFVSGNASDPVGQINPWRTGGLFAVDRDGNNARRLALPYGDGSAVVMRPRVTRVLMPLNDGSDDLIVSVNERSYDAIDVYRLNTRTARKTLLSYDNPGDVQSWALDRAGVPRGAISMKGTTARTYYRADEKSPWVKWSDGDFREPANGAVAIGYDGAIYGLGLRDRKVIAGTRGTASLLRLDDKGQTQAVLASRDEYDMISPIFDPLSRKLAGVWWNGERQTITWLDDRWAALQRQFDAKLPNAVNLFTPPQQSRRMLVYSLSDRSPGTVYLYDFQSAKLEFLIDARPWIKPAQMAESRIVKFAARDDLPLTALLTVPRGVPAKQLPMVVIVHGGPWVPGYTWRWDAEAQFLASRGYAVLQPNFRGTTGMGYKHLLASFKQWGLAMQDDVTDSAQWAVKQGIADPKRLCIYGASYGGYAAMQALVRTPELFQCAINYVGVTDLQLFHSVTWSDASDSDFMRYLFPIMVGDPERDAAQLKATSPAQNADRINKPVLMAYGGEDRRVPLIHGEKMRDALLRLGKPVEWMIKTDEGHGYAKLENRIEFYSRMESFLARHLLR